MKSPKISIIISTHNRAELFRRSLECYAQQSFNDFDLIVLDDDSDDDMNDVCRVFARGLKLNLKQFWFCQIGGHKPRTSASIWNYGIRSSAADFIMVTSPEVMPGPKLLEAMVMAIESDGGFRSKSWFNAKPYLLSADQQNKLDSVPWRSIGAPEAVRKLTGFYGAPSAEIHGLDVYAPANMDRVTHLGTDMCCGMTRAGWRNVGGYPESDYWGPSDPAFVTERARRGIKEITLMHMDSYVVHQNHDSGRHATIERNFEKGCELGPVTAPWDFIRW